MIEAGCDEAGRGCLAGPVFAAAVILPSDYQNAMHRALDQLTVRPENIIVDGNRWKPYQETAANGNGPAIVPATTIVKGDGKYLSIAAASILAKTYRDDFMLRIHEEYPQYHWDKNKGYPAKVHREAIRQFGTTPYHRMSFNLLGNTQQLEFDFD